MGLPPDFFKFQLKDIVPTVISSAALLASIAALRANFGKPAKIRAFFGRQLSFRAIGGSQPVLAVSTDVILINEGAFPAFVNLTSMKFGPSTSVYLDNMGTASIPPRLQKLGRLFVGGHDLYLVPKHDSKSVEVTFIDLDGRLNLEAKDYLLEIFVRYNKKEVTSREDKIIVAQADVNYLMALCADGDSESLEPEPLIFIRTAKGFVSPNSFEIFGQVGVPERGPFLRRLVGVLRRRR